MMLLSTVLFMTGCSPKAEGSSPDDIPVHTPDAETAKAYAGLKDLFEIGQYYTAAVNNKYLLSFSDETQSAYEMDGIYEGNEADQTAHLSIHINSNGMKSVLDGYYLENRLYSTYNGISYYEEMNFSDTKKTMVVPMIPYFYSENQIESVTTETDHSNIRYHVVLRPEEAKGIFLDRYDTVDLLEGMDANVRHAEVIQTFDPEGRFLSETAAFDVEVLYSEQTVGLTFNSELNYTESQKTAFTIDEEKKKEFESYVLYSEIDPNTISSEDLPDDEAEETVKETFKKRLVNRLGYEINDSGQYVDEFNNGESYIIDFENNSFQYSNHSIDYTYSWRGDVGSMGNCTYQFANDTAASACEATTVDTIKEVKQYLVMELYYCGLSLEDLANESGR